MPTLPVEMIRVLAPFAPLFSKRVFKHVQVLLMGTVLAPGKRTVIPLAATSVNLHGDRLVHAFSPRCEGPAGMEGGKPRPDPCVETLTP